MDEKPGCLKNENKSNDSKEKRLLKPKNKKCCYNKKMRRLIKIKESKKKLKPKNEKDY